MNRKPFIDGVTGLLTGSAATALVMGLTIQAFPQVSQAQPTPESQSPPFGPMSGSGMWSRRAHPDQQFMSMMIPHHQGAIAMADLALERSQRPEIRELAASIKATQSREIEQMRQWYQQWYDDEVPEWTPGVAMEDWPDDQTRRDDFHWRQGNWAMGMGRHHGYQWMQSSHPTDPQSGMVCMGISRMQGDLTALQSAPDFDRAFIEDMIPHHQLGVMMAQMVLAHSDRPEIRALAQMMIDAQTAEIRQMRQWYRAWYG